MTEPGNVTHLYELTVSSRLPFEDDKDDENWEALGSHLTLGKHLSPIDSRLPAAWAISLAQ